MNELQQRIANSLATNDDYIAVLGSLGYEVREHQRMFRRLCKRKFGSNHSFSGVPNLTSADDADLYLHRVPNYCVDASCVAGVWYVDVEAADGKHYYAHSSRLGCAMWAAYAGVCGE